jgi:hypothetical protein
MATIILTKVQSKGFIEQIKNFEAAYEKESKRVLDLQESVYLAGTRSKAFPASSKGHFEALLDSARTNRDENFGAMEALRNFAGLSWEQVWE